MLGIVTQSVEPLRNPISAISLDRPCCFKCQQNYEKNNLVCRFVRRQDERFSQITLLHFLVGHSALFILAVPGNKIEQNFTKLFNKKKKNFCLALKSRDLAISKTQVMARFAKTCAPAPRPEVRTNQGTLTKGEGAVPLTS
jgi:hypothetical protein